eukprot:2756301-Amphidinium_carterae.3
MGRRLIPLVGLAGDALLEPFWPLGLGLKRGWQVRLSLRQSALQHAKCESQRVICSVSCEDERCQLPATQHATPNLLKA